MDFPASNDDDLVEGPWWITQWTKTGTHSSSNSDTMEPVQQTLTWMKDQKDTIANSSFGTSKESMKEQVSTHEALMRNVSNQKAVMNELLSEETTSPTEAGRLVKTFNSLYRLAKEREKCLQSVYDISALADSLSMAHTMVDQTAYRLAERKQKVVADGVHTSPLSESQACVSGTKDAWSWISSLTNCLSIHTRNAANYHKFWHEVEVTESLMKDQLSRLHQSFTFTDRFGSKDEVKVTYGELCETMSTYLQWQTQVDGLFDRAQSLVPLKLRTQPLSRPTAVSCLLDYVSPKISLSKGETALLLDNSGSDWLVRSQSGIEARVPSLLLLVPPFDPVAMETALRIRFQLRAIWNESVRRVGGRLMELMLKVYKDWNELQAQELSRLTEGQIADMILLVKRSVSVLSGHSNCTPALYEDLLGRTSQTLSALSGVTPAKRTSRGAVTVIVQISFLTKVLLKYEDFCTYCRSYNGLLDPLKQPKRVFVYDKNSSIKFITSAHHAKFWEVDLVKESTEEGILKKELQETAMSSNNTDELQVKIAFSQQEVTNTQETTSTFDSSTVFGAMTHEQSEMNATEGASASVEYERVVAEKADMYEQSSSTMEQTAETVEVIESEVEVTTTFVITGVVSNPGSEEEMIISLQEACEKGLVDPGSGEYVHSITGHRMPIAEAMNEGFIKMGPKTERKSEEKVKSAGVITVRSSRETRPYTVRSAMDTKTEEMILAQEAVDRGILDVRLGAYKNLKTGHMMLVADAVDRKLVAVDYDKGKKGKIMEEVSETYLVHAVVNQHTKDKLMFHEAVNLGLIDPTTGAYYHNITGQKISAVEAMSKGFIKAALTDGPVSLHLKDLNGSRGQQNFSVVKQKLLNPLRFLKAWKKE